jgi:hypothetical protein
VEVDGVGPANVVDAEHALDGLRREEKFAALVVARALGAVPSALDVSGAPPGTVDVLLTYADGREAVLEVTAATPASVRQRDSLAQTAGPLRNPGRWTWDVRLGDPADLPELLGRYERIIRHCEAVGLVFPSRLLPGQAGTADLEWLASSSVQMMGMPDVLATEESHRQEIHILPPGSGGGVDEALEGLPGALSDLLALPNQVKHIEKLQRAAQAERHLFLVIGEGGLPFPQMAGLHGLPTAVPPLGLDLPDGIDGVWFVASYSHAMYSFRRLGGWRVTPLD